MERVYFTRPVLEVLGAQAARGACAGTLATGAMSAFMFAAQKAGFLGKMPPRIILEDALGAVGLRWRTSHRSRKLLSAIAHFGFGATMGALFAVGHALATGSRRPGLPSGVAFGGAVWATSYAGAIPELAIMPRPMLDRPGRPTAMILAHVVFGGVLAGALRALQPERKRATA
jgi:hypothetical protein